MGPRGRKHEYEEADSHEAYRKHAGLGRAREHHLPLARAQPFDAVNDQWDEGDHCEGVRESAHGRSEPELARETDGNECAGHQHARHDGRDDPAEDDEDERASHSVETAQPRAELLDGQGADQRLGVVQQVLDQDL